MICWERVKELHGEIGAENFSEVVNLFLEEVEEALARLPQATKPREICEMLHFLKGCALNLGFAEFAEACLQAQARLTASQGAEFDGAALARCYRKSKAEFLRSVPDALQAA